MPMRTRRKGDHLLEFLHQNFRPFSEFTTPTMVQSMDHLRSVKLQRGERITLRGFGDTPDYFYLIQGRILLSTLTGERQMDALVDLGSLTLLAGGDSYTTIEAQEDSLICHANSSKLDQLLTWDQLARHCGFFTGNGEEQAGFQSLMESKAFRKLPMEAVEEVFRRMTKLPVAAQSDVVIQGEEGDAFYLVVSGKAEVWRKGIYDKAQKWITTLTKGEVFGEEALIQGGSRNATVRMVEAGMLMKLAKQDYDQLILTPTISRVTPHVAKTMLENGYHLLDVRYQEEYEERHIPGSILIPLPELGDRYNELNPKEKYLLICSTDKRASIGALLLRQQQIQEIMVVEGGLRDWPFETASIDGY